MKMEEFLNQCTVCGGNWGAMILSGIKRVFQNDYEEVNNEYNAMDFSDGGIKAFSFLCDWLTNHGVVMD